MAKTHHHSGIYGIVQTGGLPAHPALLVVSKARGPYQGLYDLPGGKQEASESVQQTLIREISEECGIAVKRSLFLGSSLFHSQYLENEVTVFLVHQASFFQIDEHEGFAIVGEGQVHEDVSGCHWLAVDSLTHLNSSPLLQRAVQILKETSVQDHSNAPNAFNWSYGHPIAVRS